MECVMKNVLKRLRQEIKDKAVAGNQVRRAIESLAWKEGSAPQVQAIRSKRDASGHRVEGKKSLKKFRRPETGPERYSLWDEKRSVGSGARIYLLLYGMLRGRPYLSIEKKCDEAPSAYLLGITVAQVLGQDRATQKDIQAWLDGGEAPSLAGREAAE
jgi:hypothetical protein